MLDRVAPQEDSANLGPNISYWEERVDLAAAFRWTARFNMHEAVANHFSLAVNDDGSQFLINPDRKHFSRMRASDMLLIDANDPTTMERPDAPDPTAWGLHGGVHRHCPHARCVMHVHSVYATALACLEDSLLPPIDQTSAAFYQRQVVDDNYGGLAFEEEGVRCAAMLTDPKVKVMIMGNHGILVIGDSVADTFDRLYYFERACQTYITALQTGRPLRHLSHEIASKTADQLASYPGGSKHLAELKLILDEEGDSYAS